MTGRGRIAGFPAIILTALAACTGTPGDPESAAEQVLDGARRRLGGTAAGRVETIYARAAVRGPESEFTTLIWSARDGRARMEQSSGFIAVSHPSGSWWLDPGSGDTSALDDEMRSVVSGHELHLIALDPSSRYSRPRVVDGRTLPGRDALGVEFTGQLGDTVVAWYAAEDTIPVGFTFTHPEPDVTVTLEDWRPVDAVPLFRRAEFVQGNKHFTYEFTELRINGVADSTFVRRRAYLQ